MWILDCTVTYSNNSSTSSWLGASPFYADVIDASMKWWLSGVNISVQLPPGAGFSKSGSGILWKPGAIGHQWHVSLNYSAGIGLSATVITSWHFTDQADIRIGSSWYHVQGN